MPEAAELFVVFASFAYICNKIPESNSDDTFMKILITGIHGYVARSLTSAWAGDPTVEIYGLSRTATFIPGVRHIFTWSDFPYFSKSATQLPCFDLIIHLAAIVHDTLGKIKAEEYYRINYSLTKSIFDFFLKSESDKFIFFSSVAACADSLGDDEILSETSTPVPSGPYGKSKLKAEQYILSHLTDGHTVYILRPAMIHGPGCKGNLPILYKVLFRNFPWPLGAFENKRHFVSIANVIFTVRKISDNVLPPGIYNLADDDYVSTNHLVRKIAESLENKVRIWKISRGLILFIFGTGTLLHLPLNRKRLDKLTGNFQISNSKLKNGLHITRMPVSSDEGLSLTLSALKESLKPDIIEK